MCNGEGRCVEWEGQVCVKTFFIHVHMDIRCQQEGLRNPDCTQFTRSRCCLDLTVSVMHLCVTWLLAHRVRQQLNGSCAAYRTMQAGMHPWSHSNCTFFFGSWVVYRDQKRCASPHCISDIVRQVQAPTNSQPI